MATPLKECQGALADVHALFNGYAANFKPIAARIFAIPELKPVLGVLQAIADAANAGGATYQAAVTAAGGLDVIPPMTPAEDVRAKKLSDDVAALFQAFEKDTGLALEAVTVERSADGKIKASSVTLLR